MSKVRDISGLANIIKTDANGNVTFISGSTTLMSISSSGAVTSTGAIGGSNATTLATTGSNTFTGQQYVSNTKAPVNFTDTASLYTDGGLRVGKDAYVSGTLYLNDLTVYGTQSINYITSSQLDISDNIITVNTSTPSIRFGGIAVRDSGSVGTGLTGSLLWDSQRDLWLYNNPSGSTYDSAMVMMGPQNVGALGNEVGITTNAIPKGVGNHHMTSSGIFESGSNMGIGTASPAFKLDVQGTGRFTGALTGTSAAFSSNVSISNGSISNDSGDRSLTIYGSLGSSDSDVAALQLIQMWNGRAYRSIVSAQQDIAGGPASSALVFKTSIFNGTDVTTSEKMRITSGGNVGIGTNTPTFGKLSVVGTDNTTISSALWGTSTGAGMVIGVYNFSQTTDSVAGIRLITRDSGASVWNIYNISRGNDNGDLAFGNGAGGAGTEKMRITNNGNVGIGTSSPAAYALNIANSSSSGILLNGTGTGGSWMAYATSGTIYGYISSAYHLFSGASASDFGIRAQENLIFGIQNTERMRITSGGSVGIATNNPTATLDLNGSIRYRGGIYDQYIFNASGNYSSGTFYNIVNSSQMAEGIYILTCYVDTYSAGGGTYYSQYVSVPFYWWGPGSNSTSSTDLPSVIGSGHHLGNAPPTFRIQQTPSADGKIYLQFNPNASWTGMNGDGGRRFTVYLKRIGQ